MLEVSSLKFTKCPNISVSVGFPFWMFGYKEYHIFLESSMIFFIKIIDKYLILLMHSFFFLSVNFTSSEMNIKSLQ